MQDISNYEKIRSDAMIFYQQIKSIRCPAFNHELVHFTSEGFNHLIYKGNRSERPKESQVVRFNMLAKAKELITISTTHQEFEESLMSVWRKKFKKTVQESTLVKYWGFVAIIREYRIRVVIRQIGNGQKHFWSVMPAWRTSYYRDIKLISNARGDLAED